MDTDGIYTFENLCKEDPGISLGDETTKIFLSADSTMDDVSKELKAFLDYVGGNVTDDAFVQELEEAVRKAKRNREWRHEYMTLLMRDQINVEKGIEQGFKQGMEQGLEQGLERGLEQGLEQGIEGTVSILKNLDVPQQIILANIQKQYHLSLEAAKKYL